MSSPAEFSALVKEYVLRVVCFFFVCFGQTNFCFVSSFAEGVEKPQVGLQPASSSSGAAQPPNPSGVHLMQMFLSASMAYKVSQRFTRAPASAYWLLTTSLPLSTCRKSIGSESKRSSRFRKSARPCSANKS